jgi:uncharacterized repeat protein (TIGR03847 family)
VARTVYLYDPPDRCVVGTVGQPGERVFYLQARSGSRITSVVIEKEQAELLAEKTLELLEEVTRRHPDVLGVAELAAIEDIDPLDTPITEDFRAGALGLGWNAVTDRVIIEAHAGGTDEVPDIEDDSDDSSPECLRVRLTAAAARSFAKRAERVVAAGRPPCPFCHLPLDPDGHICPRANGYRR